MLLLSTEAINLNLRGGDVAYIRLRPFQLPYYINLRDEMFYLKLREDLYYIDGETAFEIFYLVSL